MKYTARRGNKNQAPAGGHPAPKAERIVVANEHASTVQFFDLKTGIVLKGLPTLKRRHEMVLDPNRGVAYISIAYKDGPFTNYERPGNEIEAIGLDSMTIVDTAWISLPAPGLCPQTEGHFWNKVPGKMTWEGGFLRQLDVPTLTPGPKLKVGH